MAPVFLWLHVLESEISSKHPEGWTVLAGLLHGDSLWSNTLVKIPLLFFAL